MLSVCLLIFLPPIMWRTSGYLLPADSMRTLFLIIRMHYLCLFWLMKARVHIDSVLFWFDREECWPEEPRHHKWRVVATCVSAFINSTLYTFIAFLECEDFSNKWSKTLIQSVLLQRGRSTKYCFFFSKTSDHRLRRVFAKITAWFILQKNQNISPVTIIVQSKLFYFAQIRLILLAKRTVQ